jgi:hypothetical protein
MADLSGISQTGLELLLEFNGTYDDTSSNNRDMAPYAGAEFYASDGAVEGFDAAKFNPTQQNFINTDFVDIGSASLFAGPAEAWTVAGFVRFAGESSGGEGAWVTKWKGSGTDPFTKLSATFLVTLSTNNGTGNMTVRLRGATSSYEVELNDGQWHMIVITWDGTDAKVYFDNVALADANVGSQVENTKIGIWIGAYPLYTPNGVLAGAMNGQLDDTRIYSRAWNASEVNLFWLYGPGATDGDDSSEIQPEDLVLHLKFEGDLIDSSVYANDQTANIVNGPLLFVNGQEDSQASSWTAASLQHINTGVTNFEGVNLFSDASHSFTVAVWVKNDDPTGGIGMVIARKMSSTGFRLQITNGGANLTLRGQLNNYTLTGNDDGEWHHYAVTWDGADAAFYYDGAAQSVPTNGTDTEGSEPIYIGVVDTLGSGAGLALHFDEHMDGLRIYGRALGADDVTELEEIQPARFVVTLEIIEVTVGGVGTIRATFDEEIDASTFVLGDILTVNGTASNLTEVTADLVYTFDVAPVTDGIVAVSILGDMVQTDELKNNSASNSVSWGVGGVVGDGGLRVFDRTGSQENQTANILIGPLPISPNAASKSKVRRSQVVLGRNTDATGTFHFYGGVDAQDAVDRAEADAPTFSVTVATLLANGGVCQPMVSGHGLMIEIDVTSGHLTFEQDTLELEPAGVNRLVRYSG